MLNEKTKENLRKNEETLLILKDVLDELGIDFFLIHGALLGLVRDGHLIPYDTDLDLATFDDPLKIGFGKMKEAFDKRDPALWRQWNGPYRGDIKTYSIYLYTPIRSDLEFWVKDFKENKVRTYDAGVWCPLEYFNSFKEIDYLGTKFKVPVRAEEFLEYNYGSNWRIPSVIDKHTRTLRWVKCDENGDMIFPLQPLGYPPSFYRGTV